MFSREALIAIESIVGYFALAVGCLGQATFASPVFKAHLPAWIGAIIVCFPFLIVYTTTFFKQAFLAPRAFRFCLIVAMCWFAALTIAAEIAYHRGYLPPDSPAYARTLSRVAMHIGWLSFPALIRLCFVTRCHESKRGV